MSNESVAGFLSRIALLLELKGENPFKIRSYRNASSVIQDLDEEVGGLVEEGTLTQIKGIGKGIGESIAEFLERGSSTILEQLESSVPEGLVEMTGVRGLGPSRVIKIHAKLGIASIGELEYACLENRLKELKGFGEKSQTAILREIQQLKQYAGLFHLHYARGASKEAADAVQCLPGVDEVVITGPIRRGLEVVSRGCLTVSSKSPARVLERIGSLDPLLSVQEQVDDRIEAVHSGGLPIEIDVVPADRLYQRMLWTTGSERHFNLLIKHAEKQGIELSRDRLNRADGSEFLPIDSEEAIYRALALAPVPPELREGGTEIAEAEKDRLPDLVEPADIQGILHVHTTYSDGAHSIAEMAEAVQAAGYTYLGISDHSRTASYAGGLSIERLEKQGREIEKLNNALAGFRILHGVESDILTDGSLDYPDEVLGKLDFVIASVHSGFQADKEAMTDRIVRAVRHPMTRILGHPTGRLLLGREPYELDLHRVLEACARNDVMVEINANPHRLDLDWRYMQEAAGMGIRFCINPDAHRTSGIDDIQYGIAVARKGRLGKDDVANCLPASELVRCWRS